MKTEGIKYTGSKDKILPYILELLQPLKVKNVLDGFSGTTRVSQALAKLNYNVVSNDLSIWSKTFAECYLLNKKPKEYYQPIIDYLNSLKGEYGWFSEHYSGKDGKGKFWQLHNTMKLDAIRNEIDKITQDPIEKSVLLTSLILALDKVDNTVGHYSGALKEWSKRSYNTMELKVPNLILSDGNHSVFQKNIFDVLKNNEFDLVYFDPPYGSNNDKMPASRVRYQAFYHIWKTIILNDKPEVFGNLNRRKDSSDKLCYSPFEDFKKDENGRFYASIAIEKLIQKTNSKFIIFSYSSSGRVPFEELCSIFQTHTEIIEIKKINYKKNVMSSMKWTNEWVSKNNTDYQEFLFLLKKNNL
jgi:adenine-specific DNA-methyltransferase